MSEERARMSSVLGVTGLVLGNVQGQGDLEVRGRVQGDIVLDGRVLVAVGGLVLGTIEALQITVSGTVRGDLIAEDGVEISGSGQVEGNVTSPRVAIEAGAKVRGHLRTGEESPAAVRGTRELVSLGQVALGQAARGEVARSERPLADEESPAEEAEASYDPLLILPPEFAPGALNAPAAMPAGALAAVALASEEQAESADARGVAGKRRRRRRRGGDRAGNGEGSREEPRERDGLRTGQAPRTETSTPHNTGPKDPPRNEMIPPQRPTRPSGPLPPGELAAKPRAGRDGATARDGTAARDGATARDGTAARDGATARDGTAERGRRSKPLPTFVKGARGHLRS